MPDLVINIRNAWQVLRAYQAKHVELRADHLASLAEARILKKRSSLINFPDRLQKTREKEIGRILQVKRSTRTHRRVQNCLRDDNRIGLSRVDVHASSDPIKPKTWEGPWGTITRKNLQLQYVQQMQPSTTRQQIPPLPLSLVRIYSPCMSRHEGANISRGACLMH